MEDWEIIVFHMNEDQLPLNNSRFKNTFMVFVQTKVSVEMEKLCIERSPGLEQQQADEKTAVANYACSTCPVDLTVRTYCTQRFDYC